MDEKPPLLARMEAMEAAIRERVKAGHNDTCGAVISSPKATYPCTCGHDALAALEGK